MDNLAGACVLKNTSIALVIISFTALCLYVRKTFNYWKDRGIIYDKPLPIIGNLGFLMRKSFWTYFYELKDKFSQDYLGIYLAWTPVLVVQSPELSRRVLSKDFDHFPDRSLYSGYSDPLGTFNLFCVKTPLWKKLRYELSPMFTALRLKTITEMMNVNAKELLKKVQRELSAKKQVNLKEIFSMYTSDIVANTVFGIRVNILNDKPSPLWHITKHMVRWTFWRGFELTMIFLVPPVAVLLRFKFFSDEATNYIEKLFGKVTEARLKAGISNDKDFVNILLRLKDKLDLPSEIEPQMVDKIIVAQAAVFIMASIDTSTTTLSFLLHELAHHPEAQEKLFNEINEAVKKKGTNVLEYDEYIQLKYLTACVYETLRKHPPGAYLDRLCIKDYVVDDKLTIEKDTVVFINVLAIHYNEEYYPEPEKWRPERFLSERMVENDNNDFKYLAFGEGPHACLGRRYGLMQIRASMTQLLTNFKFEPAKPYHVQCDPYAIIMAPEKGLTVNFIPRL